MSTLGCHWTWTDGQKARTSASHMGQIVSPETKAKISATSMGHEISVEARTKISAARTGHEVSPDTRAKIVVGLWKGGRKVADKRQRAQRRSLGYVYLNAPFVGCEGHHVDNELVINMPAALHRSVWHRQRDGRGMAQINALAYNYLFKQEVEAAIVAKENS